MGGGFKMFQALPEGSGSTLSKAAKDQHKAQALAKEIKCQERRKIWTEAEFHDLIAKEVQDEIKSRLKSDERFRRAWYGSKSSAAAVVEQVKQDKLQRLKELGKISRQGLRVVHAIPKEWRSEEVI